MFDLVDLARSSAMKLHKNDVEKPLVYFIYLFFLSMLYIRKQF